MSLTRARVEISSPRRAQVDMVVQAILVAVALALRVPKLTSQGLYRDDAWPALASRVGIGKAVRLGVTIPGFEVFTRLWLGISRATAWAQVPALLASVAGVVLAYRIARRLGAGQAGSLVAGAVLALSPVNVLYATRVKQYAFDALGALVLIGLAVSVRDEPESPRRWGALVAVAVGAVVFSASLLPISLVAVAFGGFHVLRQGAARRRVIGGAAVFVAFILLWSGLVLGAIPAPLHDAWHLNYIHLTSPWRAVEDTWYVLDHLAAGIFYRHGPTGPIILVALAGATLAWNRRVLFLLLGPLAIAVGLAAIERVPLGGGRIDEYLYPGVALATGLAIEGVVRRAPWLALREGAVQAALVAGVLIFAATSGWRQVRTTPYPAADIKQLQAALASRQQPGDAVVVSQFSRYPYALYGPRPVRVRFSQDYATGFTVDSTDPDVFIMPAEYYESGYTPDVILDYAKGRRRVWYVATDTPIFDTPASVQRNEQVPEQRLLDAGFHVADRLEAHGAHADLLVAPVQG